MDDHHILQFIRENLYVAAVCDMLDTLGHRHQAMHPRLRPLLPDPTKCGFAGRARTLQWMPTEYVFEEDPYGQEIDLVDTLQPGDVVVHSTDASGTIAPWGELMTTIARRNGAVGCVCDAYVRDCTRIIAMDFPVYHAGICPLDSKGRGRVMAIDVPIRCGEVVVQPGDILFADFDGIVAIPRLVLEDVAQLAQEKMNAEDVARQELLSGRSLRDVYTQYGVL